jgi:hypothetical protein
MGEARKFEDGKIENRKMNCFIFLFPIFLS